VDIESFTGQSLDTISKSKHLSLLPPVSDDDPITDTQAFEIQSISKKCKFHNHVAARTFWSQVNAAGFATTYKKISRKNYHLALAKAYEILARRKELGKTAA
jgi:hypothetical protein